MTAASRKLLTLALLVVGIAAATAVNPVGWAMLVQLALLPLVLVASLVAAARARVTRTLDRIRHPTDWQRARAAVVVGIIATAYLAFTGFRQHRDLFPKYHDENMHLVQTQALAHGKLWRTPHPLADAFETFHVFTRPVYASIYFPGTALLYAPAVWLGLPWWLLPLIASGASVGLLYRNTAELLDGAYGTLAALAMIAASQFRYLSLIVMSHTVMILLGLAVVWAYLRWRRERRATWALVIGVLAGWAAITRPVDALCWALPVGIAMLLDLRGLPAKRWVTAGACLVAGAAPFLVLQVVFNYGVTGDPLKTPYRLSADLFTPQIGFGLSGYDVSVRPQTSLDQKQFYYDLFTVPAARKHAESPARTLLTDRLPALAYYTLPSPMAVPFAFVGLLGLVGRRWVLSAPAPLFIAAYGLFAYFIPNYIAVYTAPMVFTMLLGIHATIETFPRWKDSLTVFFTSAIVVTSLSMLPEANAVNNEDNRPAPTMELNGRFDNGLVTIDGRPGRIQRPAVVLFRYRRSEDPHEEPVYTIDAPWPDDSPIIRAHDLGLEKNMELLKYYAERQPDRHIYFCDRGNKNAIRYAGQAGALWATLGSRAQTVPSTSPATQPAPP